LTASADRFGLSRWIVAAIGLALWAALIAAPLVNLWARSDSFAVASGPSAQILPLAGSSALLALVVASAAVVLGYAPGRLLGEADAHRGALLLLVLMGLLLPRYVLYYAWSLLLTPTSPLGEFLSSRPGTARFVAALTSCAVGVLWYWPLAALLIAQGWRTIDTQALAMARLDAGRLRRLTRVTGPMLARALGLAAAVCFVLSLSEFATFHLAGVRTVGTELAVMYQLTGSAGAVARAAWPVVLPAAAVAVLLWRRSEGSRGKNPPAAASETTGRARRWALTLLLVAVSLAAPVCLMVAHVADTSALRQFWRLYRSELAWSGATSIGAAVGALLMAGGVLAARGMGRGGRVVSGAAQTTIFLAMFLPGSLMGVALLTLAGSAAILHALRGSWAMVSAAQASRLAGVGLIVLSAAQCGAIRRLSEMAAADGASWWQTFRYVHLPRIWPLLLGAGVLTAALAMTELPATMVLLPAGLPSFAQRLVNQMHYARDQQVIASCLALVGAYVVLAGLVVVLLRVVRARSVMASLCCAAMLCATGCDPAPETASDVEVIGSFGSTGSGPGEFQYPRAIDRAPDGTLFVVDKTGRIQRLSPTGRFLGAWRMPQVENGKPTGLSVGPDGALYVADTHYHRVVVFSPAGRIVRRFGRFGTADGCFIYPTDVAFGPDGRIFVSEYGGNDRVSAFSAGGEFLFSFGTPGSGPGRLARPSALCADPSRGRLYVADACNHRIGVYDFDGALRGYIGSVGTAAGRLRYPYDLALLADGTLVVCEYGNNRLQLFSPDGESIATYGSAGRRLGRLAYPWGLAVDGACVAWVVDAGNNRVQIWQL